MQNNLQKNPKINREPPSLFTSCHRLISRKKISKAKWRTEITAPAVSMGDELHMRFFTTELGSMQTLGFPDNIYNIMILKVKKNPKNLLHSYLK